MTQKLIALFSTAGYDVRIASGIICCYPREYYAVLRDLEAPKIATSTEFN